MGAYAIIHEMGLDDYYKLRSDSGNLHGVPEAEKQLSVLNDLNAAGVRVDSLPGGLSCVRLTVDGMHCAACSWLIERMQPHTIGLHSARVRMSDHSVELVFDPGQTSVFRIANRLAKIGYHLRPYQVDEEESIEFTMRQREHWVGLALAAFLAANAMWIGIALYAGESTGMMVQHTYFLRWIGAILGLLAVTIPGRLFFQTAWQALRTLSPHVDIPIAISLFIGSLSAVFGAWTGIGHVYFDSLASFVLLLRIGRYLQFRAQSKARQSIARLLRWNTSIAHREEEDGSVHCVPAHRLAVGDVVRVEPGAVIPGDGHVLSGRSQLDASLLTGESHPVGIEKDARVVGGTTNLTSVIRVKIDAVGEESRLGKMMLLVQDASTHKTPWINAADRVGKWFVLIVLTLAIGCFSSWSIAVSPAVAVGHTMALLTIACPCALALAAPLVVTIALGRAARRQIWIREGACLEKLAQPGMLWLDKTGTLTFGRIHVYDWYGDESWLPFIAAAERDVHHPVAAATATFAASYEDPTRRLVASDVVQEPGCGVRGSVGGQSILIGNERWMQRWKITISSDFRDQAKLRETGGRAVIWAAVDGVVVGIFSIGDVLRHDAVPTLRFLQAKGWKLGIISGDHPSVVEQVAETLRREGIQFQAVLGGKSPEEKLRVIQSSRTEYGIRIAMVGDGVNDAAALAASDIGIAIRGNGEQSLAAAPIYIANQRLSSLVELFAASQRVVAAIRACFIISLIYNLITITLAITGRIHPLTAALFMPLSGISVLALAMNAQTFSASPPTPTFRIHSAGSS
jgi:Cu2+-exporting ATPase